jgi:hypothetical protein
MDLRCSIVRKTNSLSLLSCAALVVLTTFATALPSNADAGGRPKAKAAPQAKTQTASHRARPVALTRRATPIAPVSNPVSGP